MTCDGAHIRDEHALGACAVLPGRAKNRRRVNRRKDGLREVGRDRDTSLPGHAEGGAKERLRRRRAEAEDDARFDEGDLGLEPRQAGADLGSARRLVSAPRTARVPRPFEMFYGVREIDVLAIDPRALEGSVENSPRGAHEGTALPVLDVPGLFADDEQIGPRGTLPEDGLRGAPVELTPMAAFRGATQLREGRPRRNEISRRARRFLALHYSARLRRAARDLLEGDDVRVSADRPR